jgi:hypothetical protein
LAIRETRPGDSGEDNPTVALGPAEAKQAIDPITNCRLIGEFQMYGFLTILSGD